MDPQAGALSAIYARRAVRAYEAVQPDEALVRALLDAAVQAPTARHLEPWGFVVVQDKALLKRYSDRAKAMLLDPTLAVGWGSAASPRHDHPALVSDSAFNIFYDAGTLIVVCRTSGGSFADADCWLAAENLMLAATAKGLGSCCIGLALPVLNTREARRELGIPDEGAAVAPIIVGIPKGALARVPRRPAQVLRWIRPPVSPTPSAR
jgi:nitroreductase